MTQPRRQTFGCRRERIFAGVLVWLSVSVTVSVSVAGEIMFMPGAVAVDAGEETASGFTVPRAEDEVLDALADFRRHLQSQRWEKAFGVLEEVYAADAHALLPAGDGLYLPLKQQVWDTFVAMPPAGREAVRLFYDGKAAKLMAQATDPAVVGTDAEAEQLQLLFDRYFITAVGDNAADRLGDLHFERGRFAEARRCWEAILQHYPDTDLDPRKLEVKRAVALLRSGHLDAFDQLAGVLTQRYADQPLTIAGQAVTIDAYLAKLRAPQANPPPDPADAADGPALVLPEEGVEPLWHCPFMTPAGVRQYASLRSNHWAAMSGVGSRPPSHAFDEQRLYLNWLGVVFALDLETGKLAWASEPFTQLNQNLQQIGQSNSFNAAQYAITLADDTLLTTSITPQDAQQWNAVYRLMAFDKQTGKLRWTTASINELQEVQFLGSPLVHEGLVLVTCHTRESPELTLRALNLADGSPVWSVTLGTAQMQMNWRHNQVMPVPRMIARREMVYIMTNNGALLAVDADARALRWSVKYDSANNTEVMAMRRGRGSVGPPSSNPGTLQFSQSLLLIKEPGSDELLAVDVEARQIKWRRLLSGQAHVIAEDADRYFLLDPQLIAIDKTDRRMAFSASLPLGTQAAGVADLGEDLALFTSHGLFAYRKSNGDRVSKFTGYETPTGSGGAAILVGHKLITLSNAAVTAYPLSPQTPPAAADHHDQESP